MGKLSPESHTSADLLPVLEQKCLETKELRERVARADGKEQWSKPLGEMVFAGLDSNLNLKYRNSESQRDFLLETYVARLTKETLARTVEPVEFDPHPTESFVIRPTDIEIKQYGNPVDIPIKHTDQYHEISPKDPWELDGVGEE